MTFATAVLYLPEFLLASVTMHAHYDYVNFPMGLLAALQNLVSTCGDHQNPLGKLDWTGLQVVGLVKRFAWVALA